MKWLAIDTSTDMASVSLLHGEEVLCETQKNQKTHAQFILPMIDKLMANAGLLMNQLDAIVFGRGPGSFTGIRIACSVAKGLACAHDLGLIPVSNLSAIAWSVRQQVTHLPVLAVMDARMNELYWAYFAQKEWDAEEQVNSVQEIYVPKDQPVALAGVGIDLYWEGFSKEIKSQCETRLTVYPSAASMLHYAQHLALKPIAATQAQPIYVRNKVT
jgi:tRNA threonylcarbamoyladenosine biosynthesis protein TsaB